ncbi:MAG: hypothetical protein V3V21_09880 [Thermoplasmata archaeon]
MRPKEIKDTMLGVYGVPTIWTTRNLKRLVTDGILEKKEKRYRPWDYYVEFSPAVPIRLMERSPTFLSFPMSPYNWITMNGFPDLEEMTDEELKKFFSALREMEESLRHLYILRAAVATRLGIPQVRENMELLKEDVCAYLSRTEPSGLARPSPEDDSGSERVEASPSGCKEVTDLLRKVWLSREWERYVETPLVGSFSFLSQILKVISPKPPQVTATLNFQFYSYVFRLLEIASTLWRARLTADGRGEESIERDLRRKGLDREGIERESLKICKSAYRGMLKEGRKHLKENREILSRILDRLGGSKEGSADLDDVEAETISLFLTRILGPVAEGWFMDELSQAVKSYRAHEGAIPPDFLRRIAEEMLADIEERDETLRLLDSELYEIDKLNQLREVTYGFMAPFPEQLKSWQLDLTGFARTHFPPGILTD